MRTRFNRRCGTGGRHLQRMAELVELSNLKKDNDGTTFLLNVIDIFRKWPWCISLKNNSASSLVTAFKGLFADTALMTLQTENGWNFLIVPFSVCLGSISRLITLRPKRLWSKSSILCQSRAYGYIYYATSDG